jgi:hypothetical protein
VEIRKPTILAVIAAIGALSYHLATRVGSEKVEAKAQDSERLAHLERMLKEQQRRVELVSTRMRRPTAIAATEREVDERDEEQPEGPEPAAPAAKRPAPTFEEIMNDLDDRFQVESRDIAWSNRAEPDVRAQIQLASVEGTRITAIDCHTTLCKADIVHPSLERHRAFVDSLINHRKWPGEMNINMVEGSPDAIDANTPVSAVVFFARPQL